MRGLVQSAARMQPMIIRSAGLPATAPRPPRRPHQTLDGVVYEGVFHCLKVADGARHAVLRYAKVVRDPGLTADGLQQLATRPEDVKVIASPELASITARDVRLSPEDLGAAEAFDVGFETDAAISRGRGGCACAGARGHAAGLLGGACSGWCAVGRKPRASRGRRRAGSCAPRKQQHSAGHPCGTARADDDRARPAPPPPTRPRSAAGRELVAWVPDEPADPALLSLEEGAGGWDQFAVNKVPGGRGGGGRPRARLRT